MATQANTKRNSVRFFLIESLIIVVPSIVAPIASVGFLFALTWAVYISFGG